MGKTSGALASALFALLLTSPVLAGPVTFGSGTIVVTYFGSGDDSKSFDVTAPGAKEEAFDGTYVISQDFSTTRGHSGANYDIADSADGANFDVTIFHSNKGTDGGTDGGSVNFGLAFTTDRPLKYSFHIAPAGASHFEANLDSTKEFLDIDVFGNASGSLITEGSPIEKTLEGTLPGGSHGVSISLNTFNGRETDGGSTQGSFTLALTDQGPGTAIPLPPAVWSGLATLVSIGVGARLPKLTIR